MMTTLWLLTALTVAQPADLPDWLLIPRLGRGQELVYRGSYAEEGLGKAVQFNRAYHLETRIFVLDTSSRGSELAVLTVLKQRGSRPEKNDDAEVSSARLERAWLDPNGRSSAGTGELPAVPLEGPPTLEWGVFLAVPNGRAGVNQAWQAAEEGKPPHYWKVTGSDVLNGGLCPRVEGLQQSEDWDRPQADRPAWRRHDRLWLSPRLGVAHRVERTIEQRDPGRMGPTRRLVTRYELESPLQYPGLLFEARRKEILQTWALAAAAAPLLPEPGRHGPQPFDALLTKAAHHLENQPSTPYREALLQLRKRLEAARRGEAPPALALPMLPAPGVAVPGKQAPDFTATDWVGGRPVSLRQRWEKPVLLLFFQPAARSATDVLGFARRTAETLEGRVEVLGLAVSGDAALVRRLHAELQLPFPVLDGQALTTSFTVAETPKLVVLDAGGVLRGSYVGWGQETATAATEDLRQALRQGDPVEDGSQGQETGSGNVIFPPSAPQR